jgi:hypothetical protein
MQMKSGQMNRSRLIVGLILVAVAALMLLFPEGDGYTAGAAGIGVLRVIGIATARRR